MTKRRPTTMAYGWDEVAQEVAAYRVSHNPDMTLRQRLVLAEAELSEAWEKANPGGSYEGSHGRKFRKVGNVLVMDGHFGCHDHGCHTAIPTEPKHWRAARKLARKEAGID